jgi:aryl-alcohol dehydrogenase-like predicted oxidoreductase
MFIGEWMEKRSIRDQVVVATKVCTALDVFFLSDCERLQYTTNFKRGNDAIAQKASYVGNNIKSMHISVEASLKKLRTTYIDVLYIHWWDWDTSIEEIMNGLHNLVVQRKVLYLGVSDTPAWVVAQANQYARDHGKTPFVIYQGGWSILDRAFEREIIPMARANGKTTPLSSLIITYIPRPQAWRSRLSVYWRTETSALTQKSKSARRPETWVVRCSSPSGSAPKNSKI